MKESLEVNLSLQYLLFYTKLKWYPLTTVDFVFKRGQSTGKLIIKQHFLVRKWCFHYIKKNFKSY